MVSRISEPSTVWTCLLHHLGFIRTPVNNPINYDKLVGGFNPFEKYAREIGSFPQVGPGENKNSVWNHHLANYQPQLVDAGFQPSTVAWKMIFPSSSTPRRARWRYHDHHRQSRHLHRQSPGIQVYPWGEIGAPTSRHVGKPQWNWYL